MKDRILSFKIQQKKRVNSFIPNKKVCVIFFTIFLLLEIFHSLFYCGLSYNFQFYWLNLDFCELNFFSFSLNFCFVCSIWLFIIALVSFSCIFLLNFANVCLVWSCSFIRNNSETNKPKNRRQKKHNSKKRVVFKRGNSIFSNHSLADSAQRFYYVYR